MFDILLLVLIATGVGYLVVEMIDGMHERKHLRNELKRHFERMPVEPSLETVAAELDDLERKPR